MQGEVAGVAAYPRGDVDDLGADGGPAGLAQHGGGEEAGGAEQVVGDRGQRQPGAVGSEAS